MTRIFILSLLVLSSCSSSKKVSELTENDVIISMEKEGCFGSCPIYSIKIYSNGYSEFLGKEHTYKIGSHSLTLSNDRLKELKSEFKKANFFSFDDYYESNIPDLPTVMIYYKEKDKSKKIVGKRERPSEVHKLQFLIEQIAESKLGWNVIDGTYEESKPEFDKSKIIITLNNGAQLSRWFNNARENHGIRIIKKLDESYDSWVISYNQSKYSSKEILNILKSDENITSAEFTRVNP